MARPRLLDETKQREICALVSAGCSLMTAARYVGCSTTTIRREALRNVAFDDRLRRAELTAQFSPLQAMRRAADKHWRAAAWLLEHTDPDQFGRRYATQCSPDVMDQFVNEVFKLVRDEVNDPQVVRRLGRAIARKQRAATRAIVAAYEPRPDPRRRRRRPDDQPLSLKDPLQPTKRDKTAADSESHEPQ